MPLVSKSWARLLGGPSPAWEEMRIARDYLSGGQPDMEALEAWLSRRAGAVRNLCIIDNMGFVAWRVGQVLPASILTAALGTHANRLQVLHIFTAAIDLSSAELNAVLGRTHSLVEFTLILSRQSLCWVDRGAALMETLSQLPALQKLVIRTGGRPDPSYNLPTVAELAMLSSPRLTFMGLDIDTSSEGSLSLGALPALTTCQLLGCGPADVVHLTASSFSGAPNLTQLDLGNISNIHLSPDCFNSLSFLSDLRLVDCGLVLMPPALAAVQGTLRHLNLSNNNRLEIEECGYSILLGLSALERLDLSPLSKTITYYRHGCQNVQYLSRFITEWQALRPGVSVPMLTL